METLSYGAFSKCSQLKEFTCNSKKLKEIGEYVFYEDYALKKLSFKSSKINNIHKRAFKKMPKKLTIYVPKKKIKNYKAKFRSSGLSKKVTFKKI